MVSKKEIESIFNNILNEFKVKCPTIAEMHETLSRMSYEDQFSQLKEKNLLNPLEIDDYQSSLRLFNIYKEDTEEGGIKRRKEMEDNLFYYGRRLIEGLKINDIPEVDSDKFNQDNQYRSVKDLINNQGNLELNQVEAQKKEFNKENTTEDELHSMDWFFCGDLNRLNHDIYNPKYRKKLDAEQKRDIKNIDKLMERSPELPQDTMFYRVGHWDIHLKPGDHSKFKGYTSTTFQKRVVDSYKDDHLDAMKMVILAPKGQKGMTGYNPPLFRNDIGEHEYTLPRNTGFTVLDIDYDTMTATIVLDEG